MWTCMWVCFVAGFSALCGLFDMFVPRCSDSVVAMYFFFFIFFAFNRNELCFWFCVL